ncbi:MAG: PD40 domain-containing protein [Bacteroidetes bacterium]|nr:PD40 domain-containing protein [Bacteroidota bacterium]
MMRPLLFKLILLAVFECMGSFLLAQQKDSVTAKLTEVKEDINAPKKRKFIYFVSNRASDDDKYDVFKISPGSQSPALIVIRGHMEVLGNPNEKKAKISVYNASTNDLVGIYNTSMYTGNYLLILAPNVKYLFKVEVSGYGTTQEVVEIPMKIDYEICQQDIKLKLNEKNKAVLLINSFFADENEKVFYLKSTVDTTKINPDNQILTNDELTRQLDKNGKSSSNIDELVKKQLEEEKKKPEEALAAFKSHDYEKALTLYGSLLKNDPGDPFMNYYYGVCLLKLDRNKAKAINSLLLASGVKEVPVDVYFYLGKAYHLSYLFQDAMKAFEQFRGRVKPYDFEGLNGPLLVKNCMNGINLMSDQVNIEIVKRTPTSLENILSNYDPELINERVKLKTEFFSSAIDQKKQTPLLMCHTTPREYYHVSYGEKEQNHTDLYKNSSLPNGALGTSQSLGPEINTAYDENYPYLTKDGNTLYFSSKGHNSMGGYDIFKCTRKDSLSPWSRPVNMGYPINSTYDDILFVPDESNQYASYCSNRRNNSFEYTQIKLPQHPISNSIIKGSFSTLDSIPKKDAYITVTNSNTGEISGVYKTNSNTGQYLMILVSGTKYDMSIESEGYSELTSSFEIPDKKGEFELKQVIKLQTVGGQKTIKVTNYFTEAEASKVTFDVAPPKPATPVVTKVIRNTKPKRNAEEAAKDKEDLKLALDLYDQAIYQEAALIYQTLDLYIDLEPMDAYRYGVCLFNTKKDKTNCITALESCVNFKTIPIEIYYYLAKANHMSYRFSTAINYYKKYMALCKPEDIKSLKIEQEIKYCYSGIKLVNNPVILEVYGRKHVDQNAIQNSLMQIESGGKVLVITDDMRSSIDKKKEFKSLLYLSPDKNTVLYSSYGENEANGKDIYQLKKIANGKWAPVPLNIASINSPLDEEYPSLSKDGKTLYFSSKGYENMGGYDIFKSEWNESTQTWSAPVNLGSPINSPFDDIYFLE